MDAKQREKLIYNTLLEFGKLSYNDLWRHVQSKFKKDSFAKQTYQNALNNMLKNKVIFKEKDKTHKQKTWYSTTWDFEKIKIDIINHYEHKVLSHNTRLRLLQRKIQQMDNYDLAQDFVSYTILFSSTRKTIEMLVKLYPKERNLDLILDSIIKLQKTLDTMILKQNNEQRTNIMQLMVRNFEILESKTMLEIKSLK